MGKCLVVEPSMLESKKLTNNVVDGIAPEKAQEITPLTEWMRQTSPREQFLVGGACMPQAQTGRMVPTTAPPPGPSSMRVTMNSGPQMSSTNSINVPSLTASRTTVSATTSRSRDVQRQSETQRAVDRSSVARPVPDAALYQCRFHFLGCRNSFSAAQTWYDHTLSHFRGSPPPSTAQCPFCEQWSTQAGQGAWAATMSHIAEHQRNGDRLNTRYRPDYDLYEHLRRIGVVDMVQYQELVLNHRCEMTQGGYRENNNPKRERRTRK